ncbi:uncharacterized protein FOBCDRAFT_221619 [Fusarium oxysporum Fo47]|uniref:uncharacterized protein n=1 Tax=Fusarium oxysporum Fo47 TaxID=660027 RepID=UPI002869AAD6|nr:uncharacterized protein FOBCDRAFT_221619 [Fusarium oxysporum Fo47]WJG35183.1 hypothetical protein FOBCDRAFT_221619 [Fusarium oxysporum Fo47]
MEKKKQSPKFAPHHHNLTGSTVILDRMSEDPLFGISSALSRHLQIPPAEISSLSLCPRHRSIFCCPERSPLLPFVRQTQIADPKCKPKMKTLLQNTRTRKHKDKDSQLPIPASPFSNTKNPGSHRSSISDTNSHRPHLRQPRPQEPREAKLARQGSDLLLLIKRVLNGNYGRSRFVTDTSFLFSAYRISISVSNLKVACVNALLSERLSVGDHWC